MNQLFGHRQAAGARVVHLRTAPPQQIADAFAMTGHPIALLGPDAGIVHMSARFERLVGDGLCVRAGRLGSWQPEADRALATAIGNAIHSKASSSEPSKTIVLPRQNGRRPLVAEVVPVVGSAHDVLHPVAAIVALTDLAAAVTGPSEAVLEQAFGLTPAEARLAAQIAAGKTLAEIAANERNARETLRSRLKSVFHKTGTRRQAELTLLLSKIARF